MKKLCHFTTGIPLFKFDLRMKLSLLLIFISLFGLQASPSYSQKTVTLNLNGVSVSHFLGLIEAQTDFRFVYKLKDVDLDRKVDITVTNEKVPTVLEMIFKNTRTNYKIYGSQVFLTEALETSTISTSSSGILKKQQNITVTGTITDKENGMPIPGANIVVKGTNNGVMSDFDGNYAIEVSPTSVLVYSYVGFVTNEIPVNGKSQINVVLREDAVALDEVVVVGYGTQQKATITGSIATIQSEKLEETPTSNISHALAGRLPGLVVNTRSGAPGEDDASIFIRGKGTLGSTSPLIVIDGIPDRGGFSRLNPEDIESFSVLKDASAAIYGARAANGVILITTKRGKIGKPQFSFNNSFGITQPTRLPDLMGSWQYATVENEYADNFSGAPHKWSETDIQKFRDGSSPLTHPNTNWLDAIMTDWTNQSNHSLTVRGGSETIQYYLSGQYLKQNGGFENGDFPYEQYQLRANIDVELSKDLSIALDISNREEDRNAPSAGSYSAIMHTAGVTYPYLVPFYPNGLPGKGFQPSEPNLAIATSLAGGYNNRLDNIFNSKVGFDLNLPIEGLKLTGYAAFDYQFFKQKYFQNIWDEYVYDVESNDYELVPIGRERNLTINKNDWNTHTYHLQLEYKRSFGDHNFDSFIAYEQSQYEGNSLYAYREGFPSDKLDQLFAGDVNQSLTNNGGEAANGRINFFGRVNYDFANKYLATFSLRYDGSQNFPKDHRFGAFPSLSVGWVLSEEDFLQEYDFVNSLKIRASWGQMGNDNVGAYQYLASYQYPEYNNWPYGIQAGYAFGDDVNYVAGFLESKVPNPNITWEKATTINIGVDGSLFNHKLDFTIDVFRSLREDILTARNESVPDYTGLNLPDENLGEVLNRGFEVSLSHRSFISENLSFNATGNFSFARNEVKYLDEAQDLPNYQRKEGYPIDSYVVYEADGLFQTEEEVANYPTLPGTGPGDVKLLDINGDGEISELDQVRKNYGITPEIIYGLNLGVSYKRFDVSLFFQGQANAYLNIMPYLNYDKDFFINRWQQEGDNKYPRVFRDLNSGSGPSNRSSTFWLKKADFLRLKNVSVSYSLPDPWMSFLKLESAKVYFQGSNLFSVDQIKYFDPESSSGSGLGNYPIQRILQLGLDINF